MPVTSLEFMLFAEYFQFYLQDGETDESLPVHWEPENEDAMLLAGQQILSVRTVRELDVPIIVEILDKKPDDDENWQDWDQVVQAPVDLPSGKLVITSTAEGLWDSQRVTVLPGLYGTRIYYGMLDEIDAEGFEGDDRYKIKLWKVAADDQPPDFAVLKRWKPKYPYGKQESLRS